MARYVDGFVITMPKKNLDKYKKMSAKAGKIWMKHGALSYYECVGDDLNSMKKWGIRSFSDMTKKKPSEIVLFSFIVYKSKAQRDIINKKVMADPFMEAMGDDDKNLFKMENFSFGGFEAIVQLEKK